MEIKIPGHYINNITYNNDTDQHILKFDSLEQAQMYRRFMNDTFQHSVKQTGAQPFTDDSDGVASALSLLHQRRFSDPLKKEKENIIARLKTYQQDSDKERAQNNALGEICTLLKAYSHSDLEIEFRKVMECF